MKRSTILLVLFLMTLMVAHAQVSPDVSFRQEGIASWYGPGFDGRPTASGELFDSTQFTAAHPFLPFGTILTVTNVNNNRQVNVRVNDRGPFVYPRVIDLSRVAAEILDMVATGTADVIVESSTIAGVGPVSPSGLIPVPSTTAPASTPPAAVATTPPEAVPPTTVGTTPPAAAAPATVDTIPPVAAPPATVGTIPPAAAPSAIVSTTAPAAAPLPDQPRSFLIIGEIPELGTGRLFRLQVGAYRVPRNAVEVFERLKAVGLNPAYERVDNVYRVVLSGLTPEQIRPVAEILFSVGFTEAIIRQEN